MSDKKLHLRQQTIYQVFVRNHTQEGTFKALEADLPRIHQLGVSILYLLPIHPIGLVARKGKIGSPYAIQDYEQVDASLGSIADLQSLLNAAHRLGLKVMMDIVFNHTARDAKWVKEHPEYYYYRDGKLANRVGDWSDVADLDLTKQEVRLALIEILKKWTKFGFDGFRCDVAPLLPIEFWKEAKQVIQQINPNMIWFSESVHPGFIQYLRGEGYRVHSDSEMYQVFDILYDYDVHKFFEDYLTHKGSLAAYLQMVQAQGYIYPEHYVKAHFLENHDLPRIHHLVPSLSILMNLTAWSFFQHGIGFIYAGQETLQSHTPSLFEKEPIDLRINQEAFYALIQRLVAIKKLPYFGEARKFMVNEHPLQAHVIEARLFTPNTQLVGLFNLLKDNRSIHIDLPNGSYLDLISQTKIDIQQGIIHTQGPLILVIPPAS
jgi:glycosidase